MWNVYGLIVMSRSSFVTIIPHAEVKNIEEKEKSYQIDL
jgi:hypothetical protein